MKTFTNLNAGSPQDAAARAAAARQSGRTAIFVGGGSDVLALMKERIISPDVVVNLKTIPKLDQVARSATGITIGGQMTLDALGRHETIRRDYTVLAEAAASAATPQIRNVGTVAGNVCQRPWCWYYRNGFPCYKAGGNECFSFSGENQFHAIFGGGPSYIVHPSDTAPAFVALGASFRIVGPSGERVVPASEFFVLPRRKASQENVLADDEMLASMDIPTPGAGTRSGYHKVLDREAWTHAVISVATALEMNGDTCRSARIVLGGVAPIPWRLPEVERMLAGQRLTEELAARAGEASVRGARALSKNAYKIPLVKGIVRRMLIETAARA
jgi:xanthine dehydrogenase YagS FAD-binding subunit